MRAGKGIPGLRHAGDGEDAARDQRDRVLALIVTRDKPYRMPLVARLFDDRDDLLARIITIEDGPVQRDLLLHGIEGAELDLHRIGLCRRIGGLGIAARPAAARQLTFVARERTRLPTRVSWQSSVAHVVELNWIADLV